MGIDDRREIQSIDHIQTVGNSQTNIQSAATEQAIRDWQVANQPGNMQTGTEGETLLHVF